MGNRALIVAIGAAAAAVALVIAGSVGGAQTLAAARIAMPSAPIGQTLVWLGGSANDAQSRIRDLEALRGPQLAALPDAAPATFLNVTGSRSLRPLATEFSSRRVRY